VDLERYEFGEKELRETEELISKTTAKEVDFVLIGCPHCSTNEIEAIAKLLSGKKVHSGVVLWVLTFREVKSFAEKMGYVKVIEEAGGRMVCDTCLGNMPRNFLQKQGHRVMATNSLKMGFYSKVSEPIQGIRWVPQIFYLVFGILVVKRRQFLFSSSIESQTMGKRMQGQKRKVSTG
jgi:hypothetical protein